MDGGTIGFETRAACPACGSGRAETLYAAPFNSPPLSDFLEEYYRRRLDLPGEYRVERCEDCGTLFQRHIGNSALLGELYGTWIKSGHPDDDPAYCFDVANPALSRDGHEIMAAASFLGLPLGQMTMLDYGMGWASWARIAARLGCRSFGYDLADERYEFARGHGVRTDIDGQQFDFINTEQVMEHLADPAATIELLAAKLGLGGIIKISVPSNKGAVGTLARLKAGQATLTHDEIMPVLPLEHVNCFTERGLEALGGRFGLRPVCPSYRDRFAFLRHRGSLRLSDVRRTAKELIRPWYQYRNQSNLYVWLQRDR